MSSVEEPTTFGILYNCRYGGFCFSTEFITEYCKRIKISPEEQHEFRYKIIHSNYRTNPTAIEIFKEKGSEWCSGQYSELRLKEFPIYLKPYWEVTEYDGMEIVQISHGKFYARLVNTYLETRLNPDRYFVDGVAQFKKAIAEMNTSNGKNSE